MITKFSMAEPFKGYPKRTACSECGEPQIFKWENIDGGRNIILTSLHNHEKRAKAKQLKAVA